MENKRKIKINRETVLFLILSLKVLPLNWIYSLAKEYDCDIKKLYDLIRGLELQKFIEVRQSITHEKYVHLTAKGYEKANSNETVAYRYTNWYKSKHRIPSLKEEHHYMIFRFLLEYLNEFKGSIHIFSDYDKQDCKLEYGEIGRNYFVKPDAMIIPQNDTIIALEADTHRETQRIIYDKLLKYIFVASHYHQLEGINHIKLYFIFKSQARIDFLFSEDTGRLTTFFKDINRFLSTKVDTKILIDDVFKTFKEKRLMVYAGTYNQPVSTHKEIDLVDLLKKKNPRWQTL
jgi:DNA-binding PadR family transcriptional regulator